MEFDSRYLEGVNEKLSNVDPDFLKNYSIGTDGPFGLPSIFKIVRILTEITENGSMYAVSDETMETVVKHAVKGRMITVRYKGQELGKFQSNSFADDFDGFPVLKENPLALLLLQRLAIANLVEKSMPPQAGSGQQAAAGQTRGSQGR